MKRVLENQRNSKRKLFIFLSQNENCCVVMENGNSVLTLNQLFCYITTNLTWFPSRKYLFFNFIDGDILFHDHTCSCVNNDFLLQTNGYLITLCVHE